MMIILLLATAFAYSCSPQKKFELGKGNLRHAVRLNNTIAVQAASYILFLDENLNEVLPRIPVEPVNNFYCQKLAADPNGKFLLSICMEYGNIPWIQAYKCSPSGCTKHGSLVQILNAQIFNKVRIVGDTLLILSTESFGSFSTVIFQTIVFTETEFQLKLTYNNIDFLYLGLSQRNVFNDFEVKPYTINGIVSYKVMILDRKFGLYWVECALKDNKLVPGYYGSLDLRYQISLKTTTYFWRVGYAGDIISNADLQTTTVVITTNDMDSYSFKISFQAQAMMSYELQQVLTRFNNYNLVELDVFTLDDKYVSIPYSNYKSQDVYSIYKLPGNGASAFLDLFTINNPYLVNLISKFNNNSYLIYTYTQDSLISCKLD